MSNSDFQTDLLIRWGAQLEKLKTRRHRSRMVNYAAHLQEKVLRYLIARYRDPKNWNRFAARVRETTGTSVPRALLRRPEPRPLRLEQDFKARLESIHLANEQSYRSYGM